MPFWNIFKRNSQKPTESQENPPVLAEAGAAGFKYFDGYVDQEFHKDLRGRKAACVYYEMSRNHPVVSTGLHVIDLFARRVKYWVDPAGGSEVELEAAKLIETALEDLRGGMPGVVSGSVGSLIYGWAYLEKVFKICRGDVPSKYFRSKFNDGYIRWRKIRTTAQRTLDRWDLDEAGEVNGLWQRAAPDYKLRYIPRHKALHIRMYDDDGSPEGISALRGGYVSYYFQKQLQWIEAVGHNRNVAGYPDIQIPQDIAEAKTGDKLAIKNAWIELGKKIAADQYACIVRPSSVDRNNNPTGYNFGLITSSGRNLAETDVPIRRYRSEVAIVMFMTFMLLGEKAGSYNLGETQFEMMALVIEAMIDAAISAMNEDAVPELCKLNGLPREAAPLIKRGKIVPADVAKLGSFLQAAVTSGVVTPDATLEAAIREEASLPEADEETQRVAPGTVPGGLTGGFGI